jgi:hypothetical protein
MAVAAQALLDFSKPVDVDLLESTVGLFYGAGTLEQVTYSFYSARAATSGVRQLPRTCVAWVAIIAHTRCIYKAQQRLAPQQGVKTSLQICSVAAVHCCSEGV